MCRARNIFPGFVFIFQCFICMFPGFGADSAHSMDMRSFGSNEFVVLLVVAISVVDL